MIRRSLSSTICITLDSVIIKMSQTYNLEQDLVFSVKLHLGLIHYPLSLIPTPWSLSPSTVPFQKFRWGLFFLSLFLLFLLSLLLLSSTKGSVQVLCHNTKDGGVQS